MKMKCNAVKEKLDYYIDGILTGNEKREMDAHLAECGFCRKEWLELKDMIDGFKSVTMVSVPSGFTHDVMCKVRASQKNRLADMLGEWFDFIFSPREVRWNLAAAFSMVLLVGLGIYFLPRNRLGSAETINVRFQLELPGENKGVNTVSLAGDFNGWDTKSMLLKPDDGSWVIEVPLKKGRYQYMFVIDGKKWMPDPKARKLINDGFGGKNSLIEL